MHHTRRLGRRLGGAIGCVVLIAGLGSAPASAADPLAQVAFAVGDQELFSVPSVGGSGEPGTWSFDRGSLSNGDIHLHFEIDAPGYALPVASGPAVLFAGFRLYGDAGGDVGLGGSAPTLVQVVLPACPGPGACHFSAEVTLPTDELPAAIDRLEQHGELIWVSAVLTLVRTFGGGQWLQVLPLIAGDGAIDAAAGHLGEMRPTHGRLPWSGLFPADRAVAIPKGDFDLTNALDYAAVTERLRERAADVSTPIPMDDVELRVAFDRSCAAYSELALHDAEGNLAFYALAFGQDELDGATHLPVGRAWYLSLLFGGAINDSAVQLGPITAIGRPVGIDAAIDCAKPSGTLALTGAPTPTPIPTRPPLSSAGPLAPTMAVSPVPSQASASPTPSVDSAASRDAVTPVVLAVLASAGAMLVFLLLRRRRPGS